MRKMMSMVLVFAMMGMILSGCAPKKEAVTVDNQVKWADGTYFAAADTFDEKSGWKETVTIEVKDGKITSVDWNGVSKSGGKDKKSASESGMYPMVEKGGAKAPWHEQAAAAEAFLIEKQDPSAIMVNSDGKTDAIASVSVTVKGFQELAMKALDQGVATPGPYKDGDYHAESQAFSEKTGWKSTLDMTVKFGNIMAVNWNGVHKDGGDDKKTASMNGNYPMVEQGGAKMPWHEQAMNAENYLLEKQSLEGITLDGDGKTDAIASVTISVDDFYKLAEEILAKAK